ncbi:MAG TPA: TM2 domain-containing protein [Sphingobacteriaceae bacterium]
MYQNLLSNISGITLEEFNYLQQVMNGMSQKQAENFVMFYSGKRRSPQDILLFTLIGFIGVAGVQRFVTGQIGMGILYFLTAGLCFIGTIVDLINHRTLAAEYNQKAAYETANLVKGMFPVKTESADDRITG